MAQKSVTTVGLDKSEVLLCRGEQRGAAGYTQWG